MKELKANPFTLESILHGNIEKSLKVIYDSEVKYCIFKVWNKMSNKLVYSGEDYEEAVKYYNDIKGRW